jgi:hypothetical protein
LTYHFTNGIFKHLKKGGDYLKWEYKYSDCLTGLGSEREDVINHLNKEGAKGWEAVAVWPWEILFRRPIATNDKLREIQLKEDQNNGNGPGEVTEKVSG